MASQHAEFAGSCFIGWQSDCGGRSSFRFKPSHFFAVYLWHCLNSGFNNPSQGSVKFSICLGSKLETLRSCVKTTVAVRVARIWTCLQALWLDDEHHALTTTSRKHDALIQVAGVLLIARSQELQEKSPGMFSVKTVGFSAFCCESASCGLPCALARTQAKASRKNNSGNSRALSKRCRQLGCTTVRHTHVCPVSKCGSTRMWLRGDVHGCWLCGRNKRSLPQRNLESLTSCRCMETVSSDPGLSASTQCPFYISRHVSLEGKE